MARAMWAVWVGDRRVDEKATRRAAMNAVDRDRHYRRRAGRVEIVHSASGETWRRTDRGWYCTDPGKRGRARQATEAAP